MIDKLGMLQRALANLRVASEPARTPAPAPRASARSPEASDASARAAPRTAAVPSLAEQVRRRLAQVDRAAPDSRRRSLRALLESCLVAEWGSEFEQDPAFHALVDRVLNHVESDPSLQPLLGEALDAGQWLPPRTP